MADTSGFRTKFGGFNKEDVLAYIDSLQEDAARQLDEVRRQAEGQREAYDKALSDANAALAEQFQALQDERAEQDKLQQLINEQYEANRVLREQVQSCGASREELDAAYEQAAKAQEDAAQARADVAAREQETQILKDRLAQVERAYAALQEKERARAAEDARRETLQMQLRQAQSVRADLEEQNRRYQQLVGDVGNFVVEVRAMGQRYLEDANTRCQSRLTTISAAIAALSEDLTAAARELSAADDALAEQNSRAGERLDELAQKLQCSAVGAADTASDSVHFF